MAMKQGLYIKMKQGLCIKMKQGLASWHMKFLSLTSRIMPALLSQPLSSLTTWVGGLVGWGSSTQCQLRCPKISDISNSISPCCLAPLLPHLPFASYFGKRTHSAKKFVGLYVERTEGHITLSHLTLVGQNWAQF